MTSIKDVRDFWDERPCNVMHSLYPVGTGRYYEGVAAKRYFVESHIEGFAQFERWKGKKVLEIGCGIGTDAMQFALEGADVTVVDLSPKRLEVCRGGFNLYGLKGRFYCGDAEELTKFLPVEEYDLIYSFGAIHHTPLPSRALREIRAYCGPETEVRLMLYSKWSWKMARAVFLGGGKFWRAEELFRRYSEAQTGCPVSYCYSMERARRLVEGRGFEIVEMRRDHIFPYKVKHYVRHLYDKAWPFNWMPKFVFEWMKRTFGDHLLIVAKRKG